MHSFFTYRLRKITTDDDMCFDLWANHPFVKSACSDLSGMTENLFNDMILSLFTALWRSRSWTCTCWTAYAIEWYSAIIPKHMHPSTHIFRLLLDPKVFLGILVFLDGSIQLLLRKRVELFHAHQCDILQPILFASSK